MPKRRRASVTSEKSEASEVSPVVQKRRKQSAHTDPVEICQELYDYVRNYKTEDGHLLCEAFVRVPKRRTAPEYNNIVSQPIDLLKIQQKLKTDEYEDVDAFTDDILLMIRNAKVYYKKNSPEYKDAVELWDLYVQMRDELMDDPFDDGTEGEPEVGHRGRKSQSVDRDHEEESKGSEPSSRASSVTRGGSVPRSGSVPRTAQTPGTIDEDIENKLELLFAAVITAKEGDREISEVFQLLPSKTKFAEYYESITEPIDLKQIAMKIQEGSYTSLHDMEKDLLLMVKNAKYFNEPGSQIYKDAVTLRKLITAKRIELENMKHNPHKTSERIRSKRHAATHKLSSVCAALSYGSEDETELEQSDYNSAHDTTSQIDYDDDSGTEGSTMTMDTDENIYWALYNTVHNHKNSLGQILSDPFLKLPSRRFYPTYYEEIAEPLSLLQIRRKVKHNKYTSISVLAQDLNLVFENAKKYNDSDSRLYKDAVRLQNAMRAKYQELEKYESRQLAQFTQKEQEEPPQEFATPKPRNKPPGKKAVSSVEGTPERGTVSTGRKKPGRKPLPPEEALKKRLSVIYNTVNDHEVDGRRLIEIFTYLPSKDVYPDYYDIIKDPIDMNTIRQKVENKVYLTEFQLLADLNLMFSNAQKYNEEGSQVWNDSKALHRALMNKKRNLTPLGYTPPRPGHSPSQANKGVKARAESTLTQKLQDLYNTIKDHADKDRILSTLFLRLPTKQEYPNYYDIIKKPIDMSRIQQRILCKHYDNIDDLAADFAQMFDNACKFNEPNSMVYKDALTLQRVMLEKKAELLQDDDSSEVPDTRAFIQDFLTNLFVSTYNHQDEEGRSFSDSFAEIPKQTADGLEIKPVPSFERLKKNLDKGCYRRVDKFQEDMFEVFEHARRCSRTDSQLYEDSVDLQQYFMKIRDELCKNGEILLTPALSYTERHLQLALEKEKEEKLPLEMKEDEEKKLADEKSQQNGENKNGDSQVESVSHKDQSYNVGDYVYIEPREKGLEPHIVLIEKLWRDNNGEPWLHGIWFYRPRETFHVATRKFLQKEVFKSDFTDSVAFNKVISKCYVMFVKDYFKMKPMGFEEQDVWICESRYTARTKSFKKIKLWPKSDNVTMVDRMVPIVAVRVASIFADKTPQKVEEEEDNLTEFAILDRKRENVPVNVPDGEEGCTYYEQYLIAAGCMKLGDFVYVKSYESRPYIARIDRMWLDKSNEPHFRGPWYIRPSEVEHEPTRLFYRRELFKSSVEDTNPMSSIMGKCLVLSYKDYCSKRLTEIPESDVYICESKYIEAEKIIRKHTKGAGMKKYNASKQVIDDEVLFFKKHIVPKKESSPLLAQAQTAGSEFSANMNDDSMDMSMMSVDSTYQQSDSQSAYSQDAQYNASFSGPNFPQANFQNQALPTSYQAQTYPTQQSGYPTDQAAYPQQGQVYQQGQTYQQNQNYQQNQSYQQNQNYQQQPNQNYQDPNQSYQQNFGNQSFGNQSFNQSFNDSGYMYSNNTNPMPPPAEEPPAPVEKPAPKKRGRKKGHGPSGYLIFSGESRQGIRESDPNLSFGDISKLIGEQWRGLEKSEKERYEERAKKICEEQAQKEAAKAEAEKALQESIKENQPYSPASDVGRSQSPASSGVGVHGNFQQQPPQQQFQQQYHTGNTTQQQMPVQTQQGAMVMSPMQGAYPPSYVMPPPGVAQMPPPMPMGVTQTRMPNMGTSQTNQPSPQHACVPMATNPHQTSHLEQGAVQVTQQPMMPPPRPPSPMFTSVPPRTQRVLHSEAYLRYIEGLTPEKRSVGNWEKQLSATPENTPVSKNSRMPVHWLGDGVGPHGNSANALWALRDMMMKDALNIHRTLEFDQL